MDKWFTSPFRCIEVVRRVFCARCRFLAALPLGTEIEDAARRSAISPHVLLRGSLRPLPLPAPTGVALQHAGLSAPCLCSALGQLFGRVKVPCVGYVGKPWQVRAQWCTFTLASARMGFLLGVCVGFLYYVCGISVKYIGLRYIWDFCYIWVYITL